MKYHFFSFRSFFLIPLFFFLFPLLLKASSFSSHKQKYLWTKKGPHTYIFAEEYKPLIPSFMEYHAQLAKQYEKEFRWKLDDQAYILWVSPWQQIANGYATSVDHVHSVFFSGGVSITERFASPSWVYTLLIHELAHLYQLNVKSPLASIAHQIFRNTPFTSFLFPFFFVMPNALAPNYLLEGNATYNESRFGLGGRLHSGEIRAIVYHLVKTDSLSLSRLTNIHLEFPFSAETYYVGSYLFSYLSEKYGSYAANSFFKSYARHNFIPLLVDSTFKEVFNKGKKELINEFLTHTKEEARKQKTMKAVSPLLNLKGLGCSDFNHDKEKIYFLSQPDLRSPPHLHVMDKQTRQLTQRETQLSIGKIFFRKDKGFLSAASNEINPTDVIFSLYDEEDNNLKDFDSKWVNDIRGGKVIYTHMKKSLHQFHLFVSSISETFSLGEESFFALANSAPILDEKGNVYYFRQKQDQRVLYKNKRVLFSFKGFYSRLMEVSPEGFIYFIGNTPYGASLFVFKWGHIFRVLSSDAVVQARQLTEKDFLVCEAYHEGYHYKIVSEDLKSQREKPAYYKYQHDNPNLKAIFAGVLDSQKDLPENENREESKIELHKKKIVQGEESKKTIQKEIKSTKEKPPVSSSLVSKEDITYEAYNLFSHFQYQSMNLSLSASFQVGSIFFGDPLGLQKVGIQFEQSNLISGSLLQSWGLSYLNNKDYLPWGLVLFSRSQDISQNSKKSSTLKEFLKKEEEFLFFLRIPLYRRSDWFFHLDLDLFMGQSDSSFFFEEEEYPLSYTHWGYRSSISLAWIQQYGLGLNPHRWFYVSYTYQGKNLNYLESKTVGDLEGELRGHGLDVGSGYHLGREFYLASSYAYSSSTQSTALKQNISSNIIPFFSSPLYPRVTRIEPQDIHGEKRNSNVALGLEKTLNYSYYFESFPISLRRIAPLVYRHHFFETLDKNDLPLRNLNLLEYGLYMEFLFLYKAPLVIKLSQLVDLDKKREDQYLWNLELKM